MQVKVNVNNLISLISNLLIRLRHEELSSKSTLKQDITNFAKYLEKYSNGDEDVLYDNNFITSHDEKEKLDKIFKVNLQEIQYFKETISKLKNENNSQEQIEKAKKHLRKIAASLMAYNQNTKSWKV
ncbi:hypothetical protein [Xanthomarina gelatinilytica]|uniref:hypothetical protein n=1 Tax=Xanthomarina gelatinilytica TaxID=1137281 RepID=UPI003AA7C986